MSLGTEHRSCRTCLTNGLILGSPFKMGGILGLAEIRKMVENSPGVVWDAEIGI